MNKPRRWMIAITDDQYTWVRDTAKEAKIKGTDVVRELIERQMRDQDKSFFHGLYDSRLRMELQRLADRKAELAQKEQELKQKLKERVPA